MPKALNLLRRSVHYRRDAFDRGLIRAGFLLVDRVDRPEPGDVVLCWNRYGGAAEQADHFERHGARVLVAENCPLGNDLHGGAYSLARSHVALTGGALASGGPERWDSWGINLARYRSDDGETVILGQRGIGHPDVASPAQWAEQLRGRIGGRIRVHPGTGEAIPLADDLQRAGAVVTWSSAAALQAMALGVPVWHAHPKFIGAPAARPLAEWPGPGKRDEAARLEVFRRLAWAIWTLDEISSGEAVARVLEQ